MAVLKNILKKIFPTPFLKEAFLLYNTIRIKTVDRIVFPEYTITADQFLTNRKGFPFRELEISLDDLPEGEVKKYMQHWYEWTQDEFILALNRPCWIEPEYGWALVEPNKLIYYSLGVSRTWFQKKPALLPFLRKKDSIRIPKAISLRDTGEENYFHFFNDVLGKIFFLKQNQIDVTAVPLIISKKLWDKPYFQYYLGCSAFLRSLKWHVQHREYIACDTVWNL